METIFYDSPNDQNISILFKREANIALASLSKESKEYIEKKELFEKALSVVKAIEYSKAKNNNEIDFILNSINRIWNIGILSPLTLKEDEFLNYVDNNGYRRNYRYNDIYIDTKLNNSVCNDYAFNCYVRAAYSHPEKVQLEHDEITIHKNQRLYISKGGVITGEFIEKCIIRPEVINKHSFTIQSVPNIPVCFIADGNNKEYNSILVVDHREPKLKVLQQFYDVPIYKDFDIADKHYNLRKYKKL